MVTKEKTYYIAHPNGKTYGEVYPTMLEALTALVVISEKLYQEDRETKETILEIQICKRP